MSAGAALAAKHARPLPAPPTLPRLPNCCCCSVPATCAQAGLIVAGWDRHEGGSVYAIPLGGTLVKVRYATQGLHGNGRQCGGERIACVAAAGCLAGASLVAVHQCDGYAEGPSPANLPAQVPFTIGGSGSAYIYGLCDKMWRVREGHWLPATQACELVQMPRGPLLDAAQHSTRLAASAAAGTCFKAHIQLPCLPPPLAHAAAQHDGRGVPGVRGEGSEPRHGARWQQRRLHPHGRD